MRSGGKILVEALLANGADFGYCVPGESYLDLLDALYDVRDAFSLIVCRHEGGAANMAEAYGKLTGRPGLAFVTRGPGATHASIGVHTAMQDATPMILLVGQIPREMMGRGAFQEVDFAAMFAPLAKWAAQIESAARIPEFINRAYAVATSGRPGPVVLAIPEDVFEERSDAPVAAPAPQGRAGVDAVTVRALHDELAHAERPLLIVGGGPWSATASHDLAQFAQANTLPVLVEFRCQDYLDNAHPSYVGELGLGLDKTLADRVRDADVVLALGARLGDVVTDGYQLFHVPEPKQRLLLVSPDPDELGRVYRPAVGVAADPAAVIAALRASPPIEEQRWAPITAGMREEYRRRGAATPHVVRGVDLAAVVRELRERLPRETIVTNGAGNYTVWVRRYFPFHEFGTQLAPRSGAMAYGLPAAIAAKLLHPDRPVVCFAGDGCFAMASSELATAAMYNAAILVIVVNNGMYGTIRMHQERRFPHRVSGTDLANPDFAALAQACGAFGARVERTQEFAPVLEAALASGRPALIEVIVDRHVLTPSFTLPEGAA
ncbi:MAG TPA: thiamine pyrophosphate-binding protein [Candidatus Acidoferrales bacterium]|nr:thiamine pyrophosphate-binding protein [Candidatus Acidoferrales bacterium]